MGSASAKCSEDTKSFMMAEKAGRSLKLHIQQYLIRSYLKIEKDLVLVELIKETFTTHESLSCRKSEHTILVIGRRSKPTLAAIVLSRYSEAQGDVDKSETIFAGWLRLELTALDRNPSLDSLRPQIEPYLFTCADTVISYLPRISTAVM